MGTLIYVNGEITVRHKKMITPVQYKKELSPDQIKKIENIKNGWDRPAFIIHKSDPTELTLNMTYDKFEGCDPYEDGVISPINNLISYAKENDLTVNGDINISSDWSDYDNIAIFIKDNVISFKNSEIIAATSDELINELKERGEYPDIDRYKKLINAFIDNISVANTCKETIQRLINIGLTHEDLKEFGFSDSDINDAENDMDEYKD